MTTLEAMARAHWAATCAHYVKSSGIADVMPKFDVLDEKVRKEVIDDMRAALLALRDCSLYPRPMNAMRVAQQASYETWEAQMHATVTAMLDAILEDQS